MQTIVIDPFFPELNFTSSNLHEKVRVVNSPFSIQYSGMLFIDYVFKQLQEKYHNIEYFMVDASDDHAAVFTAIKLGYKHIIYNGNSKAMLSILEEVKNS